MLEVKAIMNSSVEDVIGFKCCNLPDQNLEIHVKNAGEKPVKALSRFVLDAGEKQVELTTVYPPGGQVIQPGEAAAFYCNMDDEEWKLYSSITAFDDQGGSFTAAL
ncbi:hypothetical protein SAMN02745216_00464 [Desulfatibacillum alkenivorans DSM 16219]|jgi:hypothetical protein|uniref:Uncharacterized protein n=1 Tax=Desulfatibacillum alkenivorans DSM 16219 TaxID=1121393 RepID=A0A1M6DVF0_9BACT|nr:hypothetical protein [Desulfatibacillum alkenivorans]SHI76998.1 hypothetical protein SAMN02745216_00464 [Desulfatibacillum alkenivorans DSM 16219]